MHALWTGSLSFGLINIPVHLFSGTKEHDLDLTMLHKKDLSPIRYARICKAEDKEIPYGDIVKGYEYAKGEYVVMEEADFQKASPQKMSTIEILQFTESHEIDTIYFEKPYFLEPAKGGAKAYMLLHAALQDTDKVAIARYIMRSREHIGIIKPYAGALIINQMRYASEVRAIEDLRLPTAEKIGKEELAIAIKLIDQLTKEFDIDAYKDEYMEQMHQLIEDKVQGTATRKKPFSKAPKATKVHDIMSLLKASLTEENPQHEAPREGKKKKGKQ